MFTASAIIAQQLPEPMKPARLVNDFAGVFSQQERNALESRLVDFDRTTSTQIAVVTIADLDGYAIADYAARLFDKWGIGGGSDKNNGILILIKPKTISSRGEVFIATGYGLEGAVPDALAKRIVDYDIIPSFREGRYYQGIDKATSTLISLTKGEFTAEQYIDRHESGSGIGTVVGFIAIIIILSLLGSRGNSNSRTISSDGDVASAILLGSLLSGSRHRNGGFGGFSQGGGGFGGFGGGFTGGGGAGGSW